ncbi:MAG: hypothetical protein GF390_01590 [Candidatus Pacebacteria bacterium]|nr:hypothetical protein [Candidatus Paceibacterota bacterium]
MLTKKFDYTIARFDRPKDANLDEISQADLLYFNGYVPGGIYHSKRMIWVGNLASANDALAFIRSKRERKHLIKNKKKLLSQGYQINTKLFDQQSFKQFDQLFKKTTLNRQRALNDSPKRAILSKVLVGAKIYLSGIYQADQLVAGLAFIVRKKTALVSLGAKTKNNQLRGGYGGLLEIELLDFCYQHQLTTIMHGRRCFNPVGLISKIGLFEFKARYGFNAYPTENWQTMFILKPKIFLSDVIFTTIHNNQVGYLIITDQQPAKIKPKYTTKDINNIACTDFAALNKQRDQFLKRLNR